MDMHPYHPDDEQGDLLTAQAAKYPQIMEHIKNQRLAGRDVVITSGLLKAITERIDEVAELRCAADARNMSTAWATPSRYKWPAPIWRRSNWTSHSWTDPGFSQPNGQEI